jgi:hypothetical protein
MLVQNLGSQETYHVPTSIGKALVSANLAKEVIPIVKKLIPNTTWTVREGSRAELPPFLYAHCSTCAAKMMCEGPTPHLTQKFHHAVTCGAPESCPPEIGKQYAKARKEFLNGGAPKDTYTGVSLSQIQIEHDRRDRLAKNAVKK